ncbi:MAG: gliding motility-associated C-terminal domain-containing protein [Crocinitomicaceae bacterium]|nr:gliding motility-associated C-terminal domain-containing protein [Crocinitomicaceae bacterium]
MIRKLLYTLIILGNGSISYGQIYINDDFSTGLSGWTFSNSCGGTYSGTTSGATGLPAPSAYIQKSGCGAPSLPCVPELSKVVNFAPAASEFTLSYDYRATSNTTLSTVTSSRLKIINNDDGSTIINTCLVCGGTTDTGWKTYNGTFSICEGVSSITVILYSSDSWTATPWCRASYWDNVLLTVTNTNTFSVNTTSSNVTCNGSGDGTATASVINGTPPYSYNWSSGGTGSSESGLGPGVYFVDVTDFNGCSGSDTITITEPPLLTTTITSTIDVSCNGAMDGNITAVAGGGTGALTHNWLPSGGTGISASGLAAGNYTITTTDANGCTASDFATIAEPTILIASISASQDITCNGFSDGGATVSASGGTPGYTYSWSSGGNAPIETGLGPGNHSVTVTDSNGCTTTENVLISEPAILSAQIDTYTNISCNGMDDGTASSTVSGGTTPYFYSWSPFGGTLPSASGLSPGLYYLTVTDNNSCSTIDSVMITEPLPLSGAVTVNNNVSCNGGSDASVTVIPSGGSPAYTYSWSSGGTAATESGLNADIYTVIVTDSAGCTYQDSVMITEPIALNALITSSTNVSCNGGSDGTANATVTGGTPPYSHSWSPTGGTAVSATGLSAGLYTLTTTDSLGCTFIDSIVITEPTQLSNTVVSSVDVSCFGGSDGAITTTSSGGTGAYAYNWTPSGGFDSTATGLTSGTYTVTVTDANNCMTSNTIVISEPAPLSVTFNAPTNVCFGDIASVNTTISGGTGPYVYNWNNGATTANLSIVVASDTTLSVLITDGNNCDLQDSVNIQMTNLQDASILTIPELCEDQSSITLSALNPGGYWQGTGIIDSLNGTFDPSVVGPGVYPVTYTLSGFCSDSSTSQVIVHPVPTISTSPDVTMGWGSETQLEIYGSGTVSWSPPTNLSCTDCSNPIADPLETTTYCVELVDTNGCTNTQCIIVSIDINIECGEVFVPNAFSPNGDGNNDLHCVYGKCITGVTIQIYNRWGEKVFESNDKNMCWDGYFRGKPVTTGIYVYVLEATLITGDTVQKSGNISVVR